MPSPNAPSPDARRSSGSGGRAHELRLRQAGMALLLMGVCALLMHYVVWVGGGSWTGIAWWTVFSFGGLLAAYGAIRSGWSRRFRDPSLTLPQMLYALACAAVGYAMAGTLRGAVFPVVTLILMFGMFQLQARSALLISLYALGLFGISMGVMATLRPEVYVPAVELGHFMMLALMLPSVSVLAGRLSGIRKRLAQQKQDLAQALEQIQAMATRDDLTGLLNRRHMQTLLEQETLRCLRSGHGYCLALLDIDHFKQINDSHGHAAGDAMLRAFAQAAQEAMRGADVLARWGGEEFVLMLPDTRMPPALAGVERLRERVAALSVAVGGLQLRMTVSAGVTEHRPGDNLTQTLERADKLLYEAKAQGRNRVISG